MKLLKQTFLAGAFALDLKRAMGLENVVDVLDEFGIRPEGTKRCEKGLGLSDRSNGWPEMKVLDDNNIV